MSSGAGVLARLVWGVAPPAAACLLMVAFAALRWPLWEQVFYSDHSPAAWLSSAQLLAAAMVAARLATTGDLSRTWAVWLAVSLYALALDEQFMLHEQWKYGCSQWLQACQALWMREAPSALVGVVGAITVVGLVRTVHDSLFRSLMLAALAVGLVAVCVDLSPLLQALAPFEEAIEVLAEALFIGALLSLPRRQVHTHQVHS